jgi:uncharacterized protein involved in exopolysaccharide biosynthesis
MSENSSQPATAAPQGEPGALAPDVGDDGLLDLLLVVAETARLLIFGPLVAGLAALGIAFVIPPTFTATTRILPPQQQGGAAAMLASQLSQAERNQPTSGAPAADYLNRYRDFKYQETLFELMAKQHDMARLDEAREGAVIQVIDPALVPEWKSKPKRAHIAVLTALAAGSIHG